MLAANLSFLSAKLYRSPVMTTLTIKDLNRPGFQGGRFV